MIATGMPVQVGNEDALQLSNEEVLTAADAGLVRDHRMSNMSQLSGSGQVGASSQAARDEAGRLGLDTRNDALHFAN
jgi:hypothetical protein